jgi:hypothetical protein
MDQLANPRLTNCIRVLERTVRQQVQTEKALLECDLLGVGGRCACNLTVLRLGNDRSFLRRMETTFSQCGVSAVPLGNSAPQSDQPSMAAYILPIIGVDRLLCNIRETGRGSLGGHVVKSLDVDHVVLCPLVDEPTECLEYVFDASEERKRRGESICKNVAAQAAAFRTWRWLSLAVHFGRTGNGHAQSIRVGGR